MFKDKDIRIKDIRIKEILKDQFTSRDKKIKFITQEKLPVGLANRSVIAVGIADRDQLRLVSLAEEKVTSVDYVQR